MVGRKGRRLKKIFSYLRHMKTFHVNRKEFMEIFKGSGKCSMKLHQSAAATWPLVNHKSCLCKVLHVWLDDVYGKTTFNRCCVLLPINAFEPSAYFSRKTLFVVYERFL